jgi:hypothetical protein
MVNPDIEDRLINPLNNILLLAYGTEKQQKIEEEIDRIINVLEQERIIAKRRNRGVSVT